MYVTNYDDKSGDAGGDTYGNEVLVMGTHITKKTITMLTPTLMLVMMMSITTMRMAMMLLLILMVSILMLLLVMVVMT